ncbi:tRNA (adenosine(37)-N6)-threonylcarbamoyltransferase complex transferase subunit TsaD [Candidatus Kuenenbacteria bacterium]|nr:tRNA (adenosine(37)-N6)-threonylcarbamoyltransferase complex transferase subunit TsaD [Candidatus Kuenenbacteria bacterium]
MLILGIETSCDETAAAVLEIKNGSFRILSNLVSSSVELQARYGGIVPEVAARKQVEFVMPVLEQVKKLGIPKNIDYIAVTSGPGLITSLRVGVEAARTLSYIWKKPLMQVNHLEGHIYSALLNKIQNSKFKVPASPAGGQNKPQIQNKNFQRLPKLVFPALALVVSGGHTQLVLMRNYLDYKIIGETLDDAVGEAFDKVAKILDLGYPGGPVIAKMAEGGDKSSFELPRPMMNSGDYNFSFAGLKTAVLYKTLNHKNVKSLKQKRDLCASFQEACVDVLINKTIRAAKEYKVKTILVGGGVAANKELRERLEREAGELKGVKLLIPEIKYTGDNAAMIALVGYFRTIRALKRKSIKKVDWGKAKVDPNMEL